MPTGGKTKGEMALQRRRRHAQTANEVESVCYEVVPVSGKLKGGRYARVCPKETLDSEAFLERVALHNPGLSARMARFYLEAVFAELAETLREGRFVTLSGCMTFGASIKGCVKGKGEAGKVNAGHVLRPWATFLTPFANEVNRGAHLSPRGAQAQAAASEA